LAGLNTQQIATVKNKVTQGFEKAKGGKQTSYYTKTDKTYENKPVYKYKGQEYVKSKNGQWWGIDKNKTELK